MVNFENRNIELSLIKREFSRLEEFAKLAENPSDSFKLKKMINDYYKIYEGDVEL